ncbi:cell surface protein [Leifsonia sp. Leaf336]|uniref:PKD domain-containing protein n=1 Tax=Leifsonia sp. Leaf336 TaxID=1736341 RepID=UPI0006F80374|nr:PKD domain-containing protein [Leifsonia sp. Leaf336]KQR53546.1 cell surface protein [Leifsonia sp. Leaf336]
MSTEKVPRARSLASSRKLAWLTAILTAVGLIFGGLAIAQPAAADSNPPDPTNPSTPPTVTADVLPTPQINGVVWSQVVVGNTVYVAGKFTSARPAGSPAGTNETPRNNLLAYDITTGTLLPFAPNLNAQALSIAASPDGSRIYVAGDFTSIDGKGYYRLAAFSTATNTIVSTFKPILSTTGRAVTASNTAAYVGGDFTTVNGVARKYLAAVSATDGSTLNWQADADDSVYATALTKDGSKVIAGGRFQNVGGLANYGLVAVDASTAAILPFAANQTVRDAGSQASIYSLATTNDRVYGSGYVFGSGGNLEGSFSADPNTGAINWIEDCHGDTYSVFPQADNALYIAGHIHYCGNIGGFPQTSPTWTFHHSLAFSKAATGTITNDPYGYFNWAGNPSPSLLDWFPDWTTGTFTGQGQATWSVNGNSKYVVYGGEFPSVNGVATQGLARFALTSSAPNKVGPMGIPLTPTAASFNAGQVRVSFAATYDRDNGYLTYKVYRDAGTTPVYQTTVHSNFYTRPIIGFVDSGLTPGSHPVYHVKVYDPVGNMTSRDTNAVTVAATSSGGAYSDSVNQAGATSYWPFDESSGTTALDHIGFTDLTETAVTQGAAGPISGVTASTFNGSTSLAVTPTAIAGPNTFTVSAWFRTTSTSGGKILGFGNANTGTSGSYDRHIYMDNAGRIFFGVYPGGVATLNTAPGYNDGQWHQVTASLGANGMRLYLDGKPAGARTDVTVGQPYTGYWRIGGDNLGGWPNQPSSNFFAGDIGQVSMYPTVLDKMTVANQYVASGRPSPLNPAPADAYGKAVYNAGPDIYWRLDETSGSTALASDPYGTTGTYSGTATTQGVAGVLNGGTDNAVRFNTNSNGSSGGVVASTVPATNPTVYTESIWFKTNTTHGGKLIGFGDQQTGLSSNYDRHIYMQDDGRIVFGVWTGQTNTITSPNPLNDNSWHQAVATQGPDGMKLYVDGQLIGTNPQTQAQSYTGYWRIGGDNTWGSTGPYFNGTLDEAAVYSTVLSAQDVANQYSLGTSGTLPNQPPVASFTKTASQLTVNVDGSASSDPDGTIASYAWDFGDGSLATGPTASHTYLQGGSYNVTLTVTDNQGATNTTSQGVSVVAPPPNQPPVAAFTSSSTYLAASFDGTTSSDPDGTVASWAWDFGDGSTGTGSTATHTYASAGTFQVKLTVTDDKGAQTSVTNPITVVANQPPVAAFTSSATNLAATFNGTTSSDPDGTVASYAWDFGDGATGTGATASHTYATAGTFTVTLTVTDNAGATNQVQHQVTTTLPPNQPPVASFTATPAGLGVAVNGSASSDPDGTVASYAWNFGDGGTATGATANHTYATSGTYTVTLTVTDNQGATATATKSVTVTSALAQDAFERSTPNGWGNADTGGAWTLSGGATSFSTAGGFGQQTVSAGTTKTATLPSVTSTRSDLTVTLSGDSAASGGGLYYSGIGRMVGSADYEARVWVKAGGAVQLQLLQGSTTLSAANITGLTVVNATDQLKLRVQVFGTSPTTIRAKVWSGTGTEPTAWTLSTTDSTAALQVAGTVGLRSYLSGSATTTPVVTRWDNFAVVPVP